MIKPEPTAAVESRVRELLLDYAGTLSAVDLASVLLKVSVDISLEGGPRVRPRRHPDA